jgi:hypothetical protein
MTDDIMQDLPESVVKAIEVYGDAAFREGYRANESDVAVVEAADAAKYALARAIRSMRDDLLTGASVERENLLGQLYDWRERAIRAERYIRDLSVHTPNEATND